MSNKLKSAIAIMILLIAAVCFSGEFDVDNDGFFDDTFKSFARNIAVQDPFSVFTSTTVETVLKELYDMKQAIMGADDNYVTDAEKTKLSNLSGTNTGDQVIPTEESLGVDDLKTLSGVPDGAYDLGEFTGDLILDYSDIKEAFQALEIQIEINTQDIEEITPVEHYGYSTLPIAADLAFIDGAAPPDAAASHSRYKYRTFSNVADKDLEGVWFVPGDLQSDDTRTWFRVICLITASTGPAAGEGVSFGLQGVSLAHGDETGYTKGDIANSAITGAAAQWDLYITDWAAVTIPGLGPDEIVEVKVFRDISEATYAQLIGAYLVQMRYVRHETEVPAP